MERLTRDQRISIVKIHYQNGSIIKNTFRGLRDSFGRHGRPNETTIGRLMDKFERTGSVLDDVTPTRLRTGRSTENIAAVSESVEETPKKSVRRRAQELGLSATTTWRILTKDLGLHAYKLVLTQELKPLDHSKRRTFADWVIERRIADPDFLNKIIFSDEALFHLDGYVNKQNCRIWGSENPRETQEVSMHPQRCNVWCGLWAGGIIGPYFFEDDNGASVTTNGERYREMLEMFVWSEIEGMDVSDIWFQQDGARPHTSDETIGVLRAQFGPRVISARTDVPWPPRSCDLTPLDYFLWGYVKDKVYANAPATIPELKREIRRVIGGIGEPLIESVIENLGKRIIACKRSRGGHMADIVFHT